MNLSPNAWGFLAAIHAENLNISAESMMARFKIGRRRALNGLKELRDNGLISTKYHRINNRVITVSRITDLGERLLFGFVTSHNVTSVTDNEQIKQNKTYSTLISKPNLEAEPQNETEDYIKVGYEFFGDTSEPDEDSEDPKKRRKAMEQRRKQDYEAKRSKVFKSRFQKRQEMPVSEWSVNDVCFEFADRIFQHWHIKPWSVTESSFSGALATARKRLDTTSEIEVACMDLFFSQISITEYKDAEVLWRLFIKRLPGLIGQASISINTEESDRVAEEAFALAMKRLKGDNV